MSDKATSSEGEQVSEIEALASKVAQLSASADFWNKAMLWGLAFAALAAVFIVLTTRLAILRTSQAADAQSELEKAKDRQLTLDLKARDEHIAGVETELSKQKERTATAEKAASDAALALEKFKQPRSLSPKQQAELRTALKPFAGQNFAFAVFPDPEPLTLLRVLNEVLKSAGWKRVPSQIQRDSGGVLMEADGESAASISDSGIAAYLAPDDTESVAAQIAFCSGLIAAGISCERHRTPQLAGKTPRAITISIGKKP
ncbi:MAG: hypothetical protein DMG30_13680 [Acidobacteria bacterium]|nr:MAG: hypothetical protein DMG30_13680 [Acidobacteriota bacterium]